jgi:hypothetical protein
LAVGVVVLLAQHQVHIRQQMRVAAAAPLNAPVAHIASSRYCLGYQKKLNFRYYFLYQKSLNK